MKTFWLAVVASNLIAGIVAGSVFNFAIGIGLAVMMVMTDAY